MKVLTTSLVCLSLFSAGAHAGDINVPGDFPTIQQAIDNAAANDTILIASGTYPENVNVDVAGLRLVGVNKQVIIDGGGAGNGVTVSSVSSVTLEKLRIMNATVAISVTGDRCVVSRCKVSDSGAGLVIVGNENLVEKSKFLNLQGTGATVTGSSNLITNNRFDAPGSEGVLLLAGGNVVEGNRIEGGANRGVFVSGGQGNLVSSNDIRSVGVGILVATNRTTVFDNSIRDTQNEGIKVDVDDNAIQGNSVKKAGFSGISLDESGLNLVAGNKVRKSGFHGIELFLSDANVVHDNNVKKSAGDGLSIDGDLNLVTSNFARKSASLDLNEVSGPSNVYLANDVQTSNL